MRLLALAECGTRALIAACCGADGTGEKTLARQLLPRLAAGMLCLADANFACYELWRDAAAAGAELLWRAWRPAQPARGCGAGRRDVPVAAEGPPPPAQAGRGRYHRAGHRVPPRRAARGVTETFTLITTLTGPDAAPARELAELYHARWEIETALGAFKTGMKGAGIVLRSRPRTAPSRRSGPCYAPITPSAS